MNPILIIASILIFLGLYWLGTVLPHTTVNTVILMVSGGAVGLALFDMWD